VRSVGAVFADPCAKVIQPPQLIFGTAARFESAGKVAEEVKTHRRCRPLARRRGRS
jgi:hypothetical protein